MHFCNLVGWHKENLKIERREMSQLKSTWSSVVWSACILEVSNVKSSLETNLFTVKVLA